MVRFAPLLPAPNLDMFASARAEKAFIFYTAFSFLLAVVSYFLFDKPVAVYFESVPDVWWEESFEVITLFGEGFYWIIYPGSIYLFYRLSKLVTLWPAVLQRWVAYQRDWRMQTMGFVALTALLSGFIVNLLKILFARYRPDEYMDENLYGFTWFGFDHSIASFPSGHSATALGVATALTLLFPRWAIPILFGGLLILSSRVVVAEHYISDVLIGGYIGVFISLWLHKRLTGKGWFVRA